MLNICGGALEWKKLLKCAGFNIFLIPLPSVEILLGSELSLYLGLHLCLDLYRDVNVIAGEVRMSQISSFKKFLVPSGMLDQVSLHISVRYFPFLMLL